MRLSNVPGYINKSYENLGKAGLSLYKAARTNVVLGVIVIYIINKVIRSLIGACNRILQKSIVWRKFVVSKKTVITGLLRGDPPERFGGHKSVIFGARSQFIDSDINNLSDEHKQEVDKEKNLEYFVLSGDETSLGNREDYIVIGAKKGSEGYLRDKISISERISSICEDSDNLRVSDKVLVMPKDFKIPDSADNPSALLVEEVPKNLSPFRFDNIDDEIIVSYADHSEKYAQLAIEMTDIAMEFQLTNLVSVGCISGDKETHEKIESSDYRDLLYSQFSRKGNNNTTIRIINNTFGRFEVERKIDGSIGGVLLDIEGTDIEYNDDRIASFSPKVASIIPIIALFPMNIDDILGRMKIKGADLSMIETYFLTYVASLGMQALTDITFKEVA